MTAPVPTAEKAPAAPQNSRGFFLSWGVSFGVHSLILLWIFSSLSGGQGGIAATVGDPAREVGLYVKPADETEPSEKEPTEPTDDESNDSTVVERPALVDSAPPVAPVLPESSPRIGPGPSIPDLPPNLTGVGENVVQPNGLTPSRPAPAAMGDTSFFGIRAEGKRFVYVLDSSGSMGNHNAIQVAKAELMASLESLDQTQQFQIIFYNDITQTLVHNGRRRLLTATDVNRTIARQFITGIRTDGGTKHLPALERALRFEPDVIFFLTDADEPRLSPRELARVQSLARNRTKVHCVEFGNGGELTGQDNFLKQLSAQNGGTYRYRDVSKFRREL